MVRLSTEIVKIVVKDYGHDELLNRLSNPFWFQAFSCVIGFDWHSSGVTTTTCGALKQALNNSNLGLAVTGGKGKVSKNTISEIENNSFNLSAKIVEKLKYSSKLSAKIDNSCVQDGYQLYHHCFIFNERGNWIVIQQGMNMKNNYARRYHWIYNKVVSFVESPHKAICCDKVENGVLNITSKENEEIRKGSLDLIKDNPIHLKKYFKSEQKMITDFTNNNLIFPSRHNILKIDISSNGWNVLKRAYEIQPKNYEELISLNGMGPKKIRALALVSDLIYGTQINWKDPVKYSFAHGGKDRIPYPIDEETYENSILTLKESIEAAELNKKEKITALKQLSVLINN